MTPEERKMQREARDKAICDRYQQGHKLAEVASHFKLGRQRVLQILQAAGVWRPYVRGNRTEFLGVTVSEDAKERLKAAADAKGVSVSQFTADALDEALKGAR